MTEHSWRWIWHPDLGEGTEEFRFRAVPGGYEARGTVAATLEGAPLNASYWSRRMRRAWSGANSEPVRPDR